MGVGESMEKLARYRHYLHVLKSSPTKVQRVILQHADQGLIEGLCAISLNLLQGNIEISPEALKRLRKHRNLLRALAYRTSGGGRDRRRRGLPQRGRGGSSATDLRFKRQVLVQKGAGAFLTSFLTSALGGLVGKVVAGLVSKKREV